MALIYEHTEHMMRGEIKNLKRRDSDKVFKVGVSAHESDGGGYIIFHDETEETEPTISDLNADDWIEVH